MSKCIVQWKTSYLDILNLSLFITWTFKVIMVVFTDIFEEFYIFAVIIDPFQTSFLALYRRLKFVELTECLQNWRFYQTIISNYSREVKWKLIEKLLISSWLTLRKRHILRLRRLVIPLLTNALIIYSNIVSTLLYLLYSLLDMVIKKCSKFHSCILRGFNLIKKSLLDFW